MHSRLVTIVKGYAQYLKSDHDEERKREDKIVREMTMKRTYSITP